MEIEELKKAVESLLFITDQPLPINRLKTVLGVRDEGLIVAVIQDIRREYEERGSSIQVLEIAEGYQMASRPNHAAFIRKLFAERMTMRLSSAALETLSIVAYKQPLTRAEIEEIRGVEVIAALETLLDKRLIKVVGRKESVGRPLLYGTTPEFMRHFGLKNLEDMPPIDSFQPPVPTSSEMPAESIGLMSAVAATESESVAETGGVATAVEERPVSEGGDSTEVESSK